MTDTNKRGLGRGLNALLGDDDFDFIESATEISLPREQMYVDINLLYPSPLQPRKVFNGEALDSLVESIKEKGVLQPLLVRKKGEKYEIIAGERRYRASIIAGLKKLPIIEKSINDEEVLEIALIENLIRENLSAIEEAEGFDRLIKEFSHTQEAIAQAIGKSRSHIANTLRLLTLPESVKNMVKNNQLSAGHARALVGLENAEELAHKIIAEEMNVRQAEKIKSKEKNPEQKTKRHKNIEIQKIEKSLEAILGLHIEIKNGKNNRGSVSIKYKSIEELEKIIDVIEQRR